MRMGDNGSVMTAEALRAAIDESLRDDKDFVMEEVPGLDNSALTDEQVLNFKKAVREIGSEPFPFDHDVNGELVTRAEYIRRRVTGEFTNSGIIVGDSLTTWGYQFKKLDRTTKN